MSDPREKAPAEMSDRELDAAVAREAMNFQEFSEAVKRLLPYLSEVNCFVALKSSGTSYVSYGASGKYEREGPYLYGDLDGPTPEAVLARLELRVQEAKALPPDARATDAAEAALRAVRARKGGDNADH